MGFIYGMLGVRLLLLTFLWLGDGIVEGLMIMEWEDRGDMRA